MKLLLPLVLVLSTITSLGQVPAAITTNPPPDKANPASMEQLVLNSHSANLNGLIYVAQGAGPHPTVILLHGFPELAYSWRKVMGPLAAAGYHVFAPDVRGYGRLEPAQLRSDLEDAGRQRHHDELALGVADDELLPLQIRARDRHGCAGDDRAIRIEDAALQGSSDLRLRGPGGQKEQRDERARDSLEHQSHLANGVTDHVDTRQPGRVPAREPTK